MAPTVSRFVVNANLTNVNEHVIIWLDQGIPDKAIRAGSRLHSNVHLQLMASMATDTERELLSRGVEGPAL
jgi:hypothetical protein